MIHWPDVTQEEDELSFLHQVAVLLDNGVIIYPKLEVIQTIERWKFCLTSEFLGFHPHLPSFREFLTWKWELEVSLDLIPRSNTSSLFNYLNNLIWIWSWDMALGSLVASPFFLTKWKPSSSSIEDLSCDISSIPMWVEISNLPLKLWNMSMISRIGSSWYPN